VPRRKDEPVRLTRIYTRGGDRGETSLGDGSRVPKLDCRIASFGTVDELNSQIGLALAAGPPAEVRAALERVQNELFDVGADISVPYGVGDGRLRVEQASVDELERLCDRFNAELPEPRSFDAATAKTREEDVAELVPCGPDLDRHVRAVRAYLDAGFTHVALVQVGGDEQDEFLRFAERELLPALRAR